MGAGSPPVAELVGAVGRLAAPRPPDEHGLVLAVRALPGSAPKRGGGSLPPAPRCTAAALADGALGLATDGGDVYLLHLRQRRYRRLDSVGSAGTCAAFMARLSRRLFVGCADGSLHAFDVAVPGRLARLPGHRTALATLSTKPDTEQLLSASADAVLLWDMATFRQRRMLGAAPYGSSQAAFSPAGNLLAAAAGGGGGGGVAVWDAKSLREVHRLPAPAALGGAPLAASCLAISADERWVLSGCAGPAVLLVHDLARGGALAHAVLLPDDAYGVEQVAMLPDSAGAAVLTSDGCVSFLDVHTGQLAGRLQLTFPGCRASSFALDPRANAMAVVCSDGLVRLYDLAAVRARQQRRAPQQLSLLAERELAQLPVPPGPEQRGGAAGRRCASDAPPVAAPAAVAAAATRAALAEVGNVPARSPAGSKAGSRGAKPGVKGRPALAVAAAAAADGSAGGGLRTRRLDATAAALNTRKLRELLVVYGEFPSRYRLVIWGHLLQLPHNSTAFALLQDRGVHAAFKDLDKQLQLPGGGARGSLAVRLQACLSQLAHWCPLFGEAGFLPRFAFPFVKLCGAKAEAAFELVATLLLNWCKGWFELFPNPPLPLLRRFLLLVCHHDLELGAHLQRLGLPLLTQLWDQLSSALSDLLPAADWLLVWDHCLAAEAGPGFLYCALAAYLICQRRLLLAAADAQRVALALESRPAVDARRLVSRAYAIAAATPPYARLGLGEVAPLAAAAEGAGGYPVFTEYPVGSVELQQQERQRIQEAEDALIRRRQVVAELEQRSKQVAFDASALTAQRQQLAALDAQRRAAVRAIEDSVATAGARLDDRAKEEKLKQVRLVEEAYQASLASLRAEWASELAALREDVNHRRRLAAATLRARQEEEDIKALEFQAQQRLWVLQQEEMAAAGASALQDAAAAQAAALAAEQQRKAAEWRAEDEARALEQQHEAARRARLAAAAEQEAARQAAKGLLLAQELQAKEELLKVEHQRRLRRLAEDEAQLTAARVQLQRDRQAALAAAAQQAVQEHAGEQEARFAEQQQRREGAVAEERQALQQREADLHMAAADVGAAARAAAAEQQLAALEQALRGADAEHAARVAAIMRQLREDERSHEAAMRAIADPDITAAAAAIAAAGQPSPRGDAAQARVPEARPAAPTASVGAASPGGGRPATSGSGSGSSVSISTELEQLLAETQAEVERELAAAAAEPRRLAAQRQGQHDATDRAGAASRAGRLRSVLEEELLTMPTPPGGVAATAARRGGRSSASPVPSPPRGRARSSPSRPQLSPAARRGGRAPAGGASPPAVQLAVAGLEPLTHRGHAVRGLAGALKPAARSGKGSSTGSSSTGTSDDATPRPGQLAHPQAPPAVRGSPGTPSSLLTAGSPGGTSDLTVSPPQQQARRQPDARRAGAVAATAARLRADAAAAAAAEGGPSSTYELYEPVLLGVASTSAADIAQRAVAAMRAAVGSSSSTQPSAAASGSTDGSKSLAFYTPASATSGGAGERETPALGTRSRSRTAAGQQGEPSGGAAAAVAEAIEAAGRSTSDDSSVDGAPLGSPQSSLGSLGAAGPRAGAGRGAGGLDASGRVSRELRQSSSATSEELEQLLEQLALYEEQLARASSGGGVPGAERTEGAAGGGAAPPAPGSGLDASRSSLSWSQTLAGLGGVLPEEDGV